MSTVIAKNVQVGTSGTSTDNFTIFQPATPDGTLRIGNGNTGITTSQVALTSAGNVGIGTSAPAVPLDIQATVGNPTRVTVYGVSPSFNSRRANGTPSSPTAVTTNQTLVQLSGTGYGATGFSSDINRVGVWGVAAETWTDTAQGTFLQFNTTEVGTTSRTEKMRIDSAGNVGIGTSSPASRLDVTGPDNSGPTLVSRVYSLNRTAFLGFGFNTISANSNASGLFLEALGANPMAFSTNGSERARIDSSGNMFLGGTTSTYGSKLVLYSSGGSNIIESRQTSTSAQYHSIFMNSNGGVGSIQTSGSSALYNTTSDYRLKNTIAPMTGALAKVAALKPCTYKWNVDGSDGQGFIAHELAEVCPDAVTGEKDAVDADGNPQYQGIDTSFLVATLTAAIQEQQALITSQSATITAQQAALAALTARVAALESN
jgi:hypothetical protein